MEHIDSVGSLNPEKRVANELCGLVEAVVSAKLKTAQLHRELSDSERVEASCLEKLRLYWLREKLKTLEEE